MNILNVQKDLDGFGAGTCLQGEYTTTFSKLIEVFGDPTMYGENGDKVDAEWVLNFDLDNEETYVVTVYNWKTDGVPQGEYNWHIGGKNKMAIDLFAQYMEGR